MNHPKLSLTIGHLYGELMNIYGDNGNIITLKKRCEWRGIEVKVLNISLKEVLKPGLIDLYFFGGGQDQAQGLVSADLLTKVKSEAIKKDVERGVPLLAICGGYQLLGEYYKPQNAPKLAGLGIFPAYTEASDLRMIGNIVISSSFIVDGNDAKYKEHPTMNHQPSTNNHLVGFENHSGKTFLKPAAKPLGKVVTGYGNNGEDGFEGCIYKNAIGCYMHGSLLPKNPQLADRLIKKALEVKYKKNFELQILDDELELNAHRSVISQID